MTSQDITPEQKKQFKKAFAKFIAKGLLNGINFGALLVVSNVVAMLGLQIYAADATLLHLTVLVIIDVALFNMFRKTNVANAEAFKEQVKKIKEAK